MVDKETKNKIKRLTYLRKQLDNVIDNTITDYLLRDMPISTDEIKEHLIYQIDDNLDFYKQGR